ncbi:single-stranded DNA-binding protein, partial [Pseudomonas aeruginosa]|nr:single-stranded DNA-binding protein [Pseudomonas aeruginosa]
IGAALAWHGRSSARGLKWCPPKTGGHHAASRRDRGGVLARRLRWMEESGWKEVTDWHNVSFFGKLAEKALKIKKGMLYSVVGRNQTFVYEKDGIKRYRTEVVVDMKGELEIIGYHSHSRQERSPQAPAAQQSQPASSPRSPAQPSPHLPDDWRDGEFGPDDKIPF